MRLLSAFLPISLFAAKVIFRKIGFNYSMVWKRPFTILMTHVYEVNEEKLKLVSWTLSLGRIRILRKSMRKVTIYILFIG